MFHFAPKNVSRRLGLAALLLATPLLTVGCGDDNDDFSNIPPSVVTTLTTATSAGGYAGTYIGSSVLGTGQTASYNLTVSGTNQMSGTVTLSGAQARGDFALTQGSYQVSGSVDPASGAFRLSNNQGVEFTGTLPSGGRPGSFNLSVNGEVFSGVLDPGSFTPSTVAGSTGSTGSTTSTTSSGTGNALVNAAISNFTFTPDGSYNGNAISPTSNGALVAGEITRNSSNNQVFFNVASFDSSFNARAFVVGIVTQGDALNVGQTYPVITRSTQNAKGAIVTYQELIGLTNPTVDKAWAQGGSTTGSMTITKLTDTQVEADFTFGNVPPNSAQTPNNAQGTFSVSGHVTADIQPNR